MATEVRSQRFALRTVPDTSLPYGAWWPHSRNLSDELGDLFTLWPETSGHISRVLYSPPDWDDHPRSVAVPGRRVKTGCFPTDDTHRLVLTMRDRTRLDILVIAPETSAQQAAGLLREAAGSESRRREPEDTYGAWDDEGGHS